MPFARNIHKSSAERFRDVTELFHHTLKLLDKTNLIRVAPIFLPEVSDVLYGTCCVSVVRQIPAHSPRAELCRSSVRNLSQVSKTDLDGLFGLAIPSFPTEQQLIELKAVFPNLAQVHFRDLVSHSRGDTTTQQWRLSLGDGVFSVNNLYADVILATPPKNEHTFWQEALQLSHLGGHGQSAQFNLQLDSYEVPATTLPLREWLVSTAKIPGGLERLFIRMLLPLPDLLDWWKKRGSKFNTALRFLTHRLAQWETDSLHTLLSNMPQLESLSLTIECLFRSDGREWPRICPRLDVLPTVFEQLLRSPTALRRLELQLDNSLDNVDEVWPPVLTATGPIMLHQLDIQVETTPSDERLWRLATLFATSLSDDCECTLDIMDGSGLGSPEDFVECLQSLRMLDAEKRKVLRSIPFATLNLCSIEQVYMVQFSRRNCVIPCRQWEFCQELRYILRSLHQEWRYRRRAILELCTDRGPSLAPPPSGTVKLWLLERLIDIDRATARELKRIRLNEKEMLDGEVLDIDRVFEEDLERITVEDEAKLEQAKAETA